MHTKEIVIARYEEPLVWVPKLPADVRVTMYSKSRKRLNPEILTRIDKSVRLPNLGRESHTYLTHIVENYNNLSDITLFVQGNPRPHGFGLRWDKYFDLNPEGLDSCMQLWDSKKSNTYTNWDHIPQMGRWKNFTKSKIKFSEWWETYLGIPVPKKKDFRMVGGACFSVNKNYILSHSRKYYRKLLSTVSGCADPESGHFMERSWSFIFPPTVESHTK